jgi:hypothetical protein
MLFYPFLTAQRFHRMMIPDVRFLTCDSDTFFLFCLVISYRAAELRNALSKCDSFSTFEGLLLCHRSWTNKLRSLFYSFPRENLCLDVSLMYD